MVVDGVIAMLAATLIDVAPIAAVLFGFQFVVLRRRIPDLRRVLLGFVYVIVGLSLFLQGLEQALFPLGKLMAAQLTDPAFLVASGREFVIAIRWQDYFWVYVFAFMIGF